MPKKSAHRTSNKSSENSKILLVVIVAVVAFSFGFMLARAKYKTQLSTTYKMVMERQEKIEQLNIKLDNYQNILKNK